MNILANVGMMKMSMKHVAMMATKATTLGYVSALFTLRCNWSSFSKNVARRSRMTSRIPPASPASTMLTKSVLNTLGWRPMASASVEPPRRRP